MFLKIQVFSIVFWLFFLSIIRFVLVLKERLRRKMKFHKKTKETLNSVKSIMCTYFRAGNRLKYLFSLLIRAIFGGRAKFPSSLSLAFPQQDKGRKQDGKAHRLR